MYFSLDSPKKQTEKRAMCQSLNLECNAKESEEGSWKN